MRNVSGRLRHILQPPSMLLKLMVDAACYLGLCLRPHPTLAAEVLFLRKQLARYEERQVKPRRAPNATRILMVWLSHCFDWRAALRIVTPETLTHWHRQGFRLFWKWKSKSGRPPLPKDLQALIRRMALENPTWGQERIANELLLKLGLRVSPRTVRKYMPSHCVGGPGKRCSSQRGSTFIRNQARGIVACDFCVAITATFRILYVFVIIEHASRRLIHVNVTSHPTAQWTLQQFREAIPVDHEYRFLIHDRDSVFSKQVDQSVRRMGLRVIKTPVRTPVANAICERMIGTMRRECLDFVIPLNERHLHGILKEWRVHYNEGRPHMSLGPGIPQLPASLLAPRQPHRHRLLGPQRVRSRPVLGGLHHEYRLEGRAAEAVPHDDAHRRPQWHEHLRENAMTDNPLDQAQRLVDQLTPIDQVRLLAYVANRVAQVFPATSTAADRPEPVDAWERFFELGEELAATDTPACDTLTAAVLAMRR